MVALARNYIWMGLAEKNIVLKICLMNKKNALRSVLAITHV